MVNLISPKQRVALVRLYLVRLTSTASFAFAVAGVVTVLLLLPSYFIIHADADQAAEYVETATQLSTERAKSQSPETLQRFQEEVNFLTVAARPPALARVLSVVTEDRPAGVYIQSMSLTFVSADSATIALEGTARTRAELIAYSNMLKKVPELSAVVVPVSALVADVDSTFTLSATWTRPKNP